MVILWVLSAWVGADLLAGLFHWFEDRVLLEDTGIAWLEVVRTDNGNHHAMPGAMLRFSEWENVKMSIFVTWPISGTLALFGCYWWSLVFFFGSFANLVHRFAHMHPLTQPRVVRWLQKSGLFISTKQHRLHHYHEVGNCLLLTKKERTTGNYCVMTGWTNPILDTLRVWDLLNAMFGL